jgi:hypothetical protein
MRTLLARDERQVSVDRAGDWLAYIVVSYGALVIAAYRSFVERQATWDLLALVIVGGMVGWAYRAAKRVLDRQAMLLLGLTIAVAAGLAIATTFLLGR